MGILLLTSSANREYLMADETEKAKALEEAVRLLEFVKIDPRQIGEIDFDEAQIDGYVTTALSAARAALSAITKREDSGNLR